MLNNKDKNYLTTLVTNWVLSIGPLNTSRAVKILNAILLGPLSEENREVMILSKNAALITLYTLLHETPDQDPEIPVYLRELLNQQLIELRKTITFPPHNMNRANHMQGETFFGYLYHLAEVAPEECARFLRIPKYKNVLSDSLAAIIIKNNPSVAALLRDSYNFTTFSLHTIYTQLNATQADKRHVIDAQPYFSSLYSKDKDGFTVPAPSHMMRDAKYAVVACEAAAHLDTNKCLAWLKMPDIVAQLNDEYIAWIIKGHAKLARALINESIQETALGKKAGRITFFTAACTIANHTPTPTHMMLTPTQWEVMGQLLRQMFLLTAQEYIEIAKQCYIYDFDPSLSLPSTTLRKMSRSQLIAYCFDANHFREYAILPLFLDDVLRHTLGVSMQVRLLDQLPNLARLIASAGVNFLLRLESMTLFTLCKITLKKQIDIALFVMSTGLRENLNVEQQLILVTEYPVLTDALLNKGHATWLAFNKEVLLAMFDTTAKKYKLLPQPSEMLTFKQQITMIQSFPPFAMSLLNMGIPTLISFDREVLLAIFEVAANHCPAPPSRLKINDNISLDDSTMAELKKEYTPIVTALQEDKKLVALQNEGPGDPSTQQAANANRLFTPRVVEKKRKLSAAVIPLNRQPTQVQPPCP